MQQRYCTITKAIFYCFTLIFLDQISKAYALKYFAEPLKITNYFSLVLFYNKGVSFGLLNFENIYLYNLLIFSILSLIVFISIVFIKNIKESYKIPVGQLLLLSGAISNFIDRFTNKAVIDFIYLNYKDYYWPAFNLADCYIVLGISIIVFGILYENKKYS